MHAVGWHNFPTGERGGGAERSGQAAKIVQFQIFDMDTTVTPDIKERGNRHEDK